MSIDEIIAALIEATEPDPDLNAKLLRALGWRVNQREIINPDGIVTRGVPDYVWSVDAALNLVPKGAWWNVGRNTADNSPLRHFGPGPGHCFHAGASLSYGAHSHHTGATAPIALCIAALKARAPA